jgi:sarcosine oxidase subunit gamma
LLLRKGTAAKVAGQEFHPSGTASTCGKTPELSAFADCATVVSMQPKAFVCPEGPLSIVSVTAWRGRGSALAGAVLTQFGLELPQNGWWGEHSGLTAVWTGPGHWWFQRAGRTLLLNELAPFSAHAGLIDISDGRAVRRASGPGLCEMMMSLLPLDLHPRAFLPGHAASTVAAHMAVQVRQVDDGPTDELSCQRSYAGSLWRALELAGAGGIAMQQDIAE